MPKIRIRITDDTGQPRPNQGIFEIETDFSRVKFEEGQRTLIGAIPNTTEIGEFFEVRGIENDDKGCIFDVVALDTKEFW